MKIGVIMKNVDPPLSSILLWILKTRASFWREKERESEKVFVMITLLKIRKRKTSLLVYWVTNNERYDGGSFDSCQ